MRALIVRSAVVAMFVAGCGVPGVDAGGDPVQAGDPGATATIGTDDGTSTEAGQELTLASDLAPYFDPVAGGTTPSQTFSVVGTLKPAAPGWAEIELLEGHQQFRTENYNRRTEKLRAQDTFASSTYPLRTYFGALNQQIVDAFNLAYQNTCATKSGAKCPAKGPTRPEARYVLLHKGPKTAARTCDVTKTPTLLVHGAMQDANVWLFPSGNDGKGNAYGGATQLTGMVQALEDAGRCTYAVTFGNFHGDNFNQAIQVANAVARVKQLHPGVDRVDVIAWSKGALAVDAWLTNAPKWTGFSTTKFFERLAKAQAARVPAYDDSVRVYVALSGPHGGIDLNFRHPIHALTIASTPWNAPVGRGPMPWTYFSAFQCVTWGYDSPLYDNPYAQSVCASAGGTWPDYFRRIYVSNVTGLDASGKPVSTQTLKALNVDQGLSGSSFDFDEYNLSLFGSVDDSGKWASAYLGQLQSVQDLRASYPIPDRTSSEWSDVDPDEKKYFPWVDQKLSYNPYNAFLAAGYLDDADHTTCRTTAFDPESSPCFAYHAYNVNSNAEGYDGAGYGKYRVLDGLGIDAAKELGGRFMDRLASRSLDTRLQSLYVIYGTSLGSSADSVFETDGMSCPTCTVHGDGVLFEKSIAGKTQLTKSWTASKKAADAKQEGVALGHLELGASPEVWSKVIAHLESRD